MKKLSLPLAVAIGLGTLAQQASAAGFIEDSKATLGLRNFYYNRNDVNTADNASEAAEWGQAFMLNYSSGFTEGTVGFGLDAVGLLGLKLDGGGDGDSSDDYSRKPGQLFPTESNGKARDEYSKLGVTAKVRISKTEGRIGTLRPMLPVVLSNDGRLLPQMYEGGQITSNEFDNLTLIGGQLEHAVARSSSDETGLRIASNDSKKPNNFESKFYYAGADYQITKDLKAQYYYGNLEEFYKQHFLGLVHNLAIGSGSLKTDLRYFHSTSDGKNSNGEAGYISKGYWHTGDAHTGEVDNDTWSAMFTYSLSGHALSLGYQQVEGRSDFPFLNQGDGSDAYLFTNRQIGKFLSAGERSWQAEYAYDFANLGVPGLKASASYTSGDNIKAADGDRKEWERDFRVDYVLQEGSLKGLGFTWRNGMLRSNVKGTNDTNENRLIVSYTLPLL